MLQCNGASRGNCSISYRVGTQLAACLIVRYRSVALSPGPVDGGGRWCAGIPDTNRCAAHDDDTSRSNARRAYQMTCQTDYFETTTTITLRNHGGSLLPRLYEMSKTRGQLCSAPLGLAGMQAIWESMRLWLYRAPGRVAEASSS